MAKQIYLDYAAATPMRAEVVKAIHPYLTELFYNPSATYLAARATRQQLEEARGSVAQTLGARPAEVVFTPGATEANNLAIQGVQRIFPGSEIIASAIEHESVLAPVRLAKHKLARVDQQGIIDLKKLENLINDKTVLLSVGLVNNELGTIQPIKEIVQILNKLRNERKAKRNKLPLYLHIDAAQAGNYLDLHVARLGVDLLSINGGKIYGPKQSGALYIKAGTKLAPLIVGGGQELGLRSGTESLASIAGLATALDLAQQKHKAEAKRVLGLRQGFESELMQLIPNSRINGSVKRRAPHITSLSIPDIDNERVMMELDERGIMCAVGSACSASSAESSHVLAAIGMSDAEARTTLRFSIGYQTKPEDLSFSARALAQLVNT